MGGQGQPGNQNPSQQPSQSGNKRKRLNDGVQQQQQLQPQQSQQQQQQQQQQQYSQQQSQLFASDPTLQSRYAGLAGTGYRATPGVPSSLQPTLGDVVPQPVTSQQQQPSQNGGDPSDVSGGLGARPSIGSEEWHRQ